MTLFFRVKHCFDKNIITNNQEKICFMVGIRIRHLDVRFRGWNYDMAFSHTENSRDNNASHCAVFEHLLFLASVLV